MVGLVSVQNTDVILVVLLRHHLVNPEAVCLMISFGAGAGCFLLMRAAAGKKEVACGQYLLVVSR